MRRRLRWMLAAGAVVGAAPTFVVACSSSDPAENADGGPLVDATIDTFVDYGYDLDSSYDGPDYERVRLMNDKCLPGALTIDDASMVPCHMILFFPVPEFPEGTTCAGLGLPDAVKSDGDYLEAYSAVNGVPLPFGTFCGLDQEAMNTCILHDSGVSDDAAVDLDADADADAGRGKQAWCYAFGHACREDASCNEALCTTDSYDPDPETYAWLACP